MAHDDLINRALASGAIKNPHGNAACALRTLASRDLSAATTFASRSRTAKERVMLGLAIDSPGVAYEDAVRMTAAFGSRDPEAALAARYGDEGASPMLRAVAQAKAPTDSNAGDEQLSEAGVNPRLVNDLARMFGAADPDAAVANAIKRGALQ